MVIGEHVWPHLSVIQIFPVPLAGGVLLRIEALLGLPPQLVSIGLVDRHGAFTLPGLIRRGLFNLAPFSVLARPRRSLGEILGHAVEVFGGAHLAQRLPWSLVHMVHLHPHVLKAALRPAQKLVVFHVPGLNLRLRKTL